MTNPKISMIKFNEFLMKSKEIFKFFCDEYVKVIKTVTTE